MPKDQSDEGQYWFFQEMIYDDGRVIYHMYNVKSGIDFKSVYIAGWGNPLMDSKLPEDDVRDEWMLHEVQGETIDKKDGGFTWFTDDYV